jgi:hypothetical protein
MSVIEMAEKEEPSVPPAGQAPGEAIRPHQPLSEALVRMYRGSGAPDEAPGGIGEFGHSRTNPVPTSSLEACARYLARLRQLGGQRVVWTHSATIAVGLNAKPILQYAIHGMDGRALTKLYLSPGYPATSGKAPRGFLLEPLAPGA